MVKGKPQAFKWGPKKATPKPKCKDKLEIDLLPERLKANFWK